MSGLNQTPNEYSRQMGPLFDAMPKTVIAAVAVSFASNGGDYLSLAERQIAYEWYILWESGIVTQKPNKRARVLAHWHAVITEIPL